MGAFGTREQKQITKETQTVDQHYAQSILFMALGNLETLQQVLSGSKKEKEFAMYDKYDYSSKTIDELKGQLRNNVMLFRESKRAFEKTYQKGSYILPQNYSIDKVRRRLSDFRSFFAMKKEIECVHLCTDIQKILIDQPTDLYYEKMQVIDDRDAITKKTLVNNAIKATHLMDDEEKEVKELFKNNMKPENLQFKPNPKYIAEKV